MNKRNLPENWWKDLDKNWVALYKDKQVVNNSYVEEISRIIFDHYKELGLPEEPGRTTKSFKTKGHDGSAEIKKDIGKNGEIKFTEKRFCRALYNLNKEKTLGKVFPKASLIDYQIPLKEKRGQNYGEIDLLAVKDGKEKKLWIIELKKNCSKESILRAILEVFTYINLINRKNNKFQRDFNCPEYTLVPVVLTFAGSKSGDQLQKLKNSKEFKYLKILIKKLNSENDKKSIDNMKFFIIKVKRIQTVKLLYRKEDKKIILNKEGGKVFQNKKIFEEIRWES